MSDDVSYELVPANVDYNFEGTVEKVYRAAQCISVATLWLREHKVVLSCHIHGLGKSRDKQEPLFFWLRLQQLRSGTRARHSLPWFSETCLFVLNLAAESFASQWFTFLNIRWWLLLLVWVWLVNKFDFVEDLLVYFVHILLNELICDNSTARTNIVLIASRFENDVNQFADNT